MVAGKLGGKVLQRWRGYWWVSCFAKYCQ